MPKKPNPSDDADRCRRTALAFVWTALLGALPGVLFALALLAAPS